MSFLKIKDKQIATKPADLLIVLLNHWAMTMRLIHSQYLTGVLNQVRRTRKGFLEAAWRQGFVLLIYQMKSHHVYMMHRISVLILGCMILEEEFFKYLLTTEYKKSPLFNGLFKKEHMQQKKQGGKEYLLHRYICNINANQYFLIRKWSHLSDSN